jgi:predicted metal-dependent HD superfamily phosphohydrolase
MMKDRWQKLAALRVPQDILGELVQAYSSPERYYHNLMHIQDCLSIFEQTSFLAARPEEVELVIWFHDAVYDTRRSDNEEKSAAWAEAVILQVGLSRGSGNRSLLQPGRGSWAIKRGEDFP